MNSRPLFARLVALGFATSMVAIAILLVLRPQADAQDDADVPPPPEMDLACPPGDVIGSASYDYDYSATADAKMEAADALASFLAKSGLDVEAKLIPEVFEIKKEAVGTVYVIVSDTGQELIRYTIDPVGRGYAVTAVDACRSAMLMLHEEFGQ